MFENKRTPRILIVVVQFCLALSLFVACAKEEVVQPPSKPIEEVHTPNLSVATQAPVTTPLLPSAVPTPDEENPSIDETESDETAEYMDQSGNAALEEYIDRVDSGMYFVNQATGYVAYLVDVWDGFGSVFINGAEAFNFEVYEFAHYPKKAYFDYTEPDKKGTESILYYYDKDILVLKGVCDGKDISGTYNMVQNEPPLPSDNIWGDYSTPWLDEMFDGMGDD